MNYVCEFESSSIDAERASRELFDAFAWIDDDTNDAADGTNDDDNDDEVVVVEVVVIVDAGTSCCCWALLVVVTTIDDAEDGCFEAFVIDVVVSIDVAEFDTINAPSAPISLLFREFSVWVLWFKSIFFFFTNHWYSVQSLQHQPR